MEIVNKERNKDKDKDSANLLSYQLYEAVVMSDFAAAQKLMDAGADVNHRYSPPNYQSDTSLIASIYDSNLEMVKLLLQNGADIHLRDGGGETPLTKAVFTGKVELVEALINHGANINLQSGMCGNTPLMDVLRVHEDDEIIDGLLRLLLRYGADPYKKNYDGENLFAYAKGWKQLPPELVQKPQENRFETVGRAITGWFQRK